MNRTMLLQWHQWARSPPTLRGVGLAVRPLSSTTTASAVATTPTNDDVPRNNDDDTRTRYRSRESAVRDPYGKYVVQWTEVPRNNPRRMATSTEIHVRHARLVTHQHQTLVDRPRPLHAASSLSSNDQSRSGGGGGGVLQGILVNKDTTVERATELIQDGKYLIFDYGDYNQVRKLWRKLKQWHIDTQWEPLVQQQQQEQEHPENQTPISELWTQQREFARDQAKFLNRLLLKVLIKKVRGPPETFGIHHHGKNSKHKNKKNAKVTAHQPSHTHFALPAYNRAPTEISEILRHGFGESRAFLRDQLSRNSSSVILVPLREIMGMDDAHQWRKTGVKIQPNLLMKTASKSTTTTTSSEDTTEDATAAATTAMDKNQVPIAPFRIHPHYGVFRPNNRHQYLNLILQQPLPPLPAATSTTTSSTSKKNEKLFTMMDVGVGSGVITAMMLRAQRVDQVIATDSNPNAIRCAQENFQRIRVLDRTRLIQLDEGQIFPDASSRFMTAQDCYADLIVANPPWIPGPADSLLDAAMYDPDSQFLRSFLSQVPQHFKTSDSEAWLILSDLAERLGLREAGEVKQWIHDANLEIVGQSFATVRPPVSSSDEETTTTTTELPESKPGKFGRIEQVRAGEVTQLFRLKKQSL